MYKSTVISHISTELIQAADNTLRSEIYFIWNKKTVTWPVCKKRDESVVIIEKLLGTIVWISTMVAYYVLDIYILEESLYKN